MRRFSACGLSLFLTLVLVCFVASCAKKVGGVQEKAVVKAAQPVAQPETVVASKPVEAPAPPSAKEPPVTVEAPPALRVVESPPAPPVEPEPVIEGASAKAVAAELAVKEGRTSSGLAAVYFDFDKFSVRNDMVSRLQDDAKWLKDNAKAKIRIEGNCDERGSNEYNLALGERRANSAKEYLTNLGIAPDRLETLSYGEEKPLALGHNEEAWGENRRTHFVVSSK